MTIPNCECALCLYVGDCIDDGEAYICKDSEACKARQAAYARVNALFRQKLDTLIIETCRFCREGVPLEGNNHWLERGDDRIPIRCDASDIRAMRGRQ